MGAASAFVASFIMVVCSAVLGLAALGFVGRVLSALLGRLPAAINVHHRAASWLDEHAAPEWRLAARLHSTQLSVFWAVVGGLWVALPAFQSFVPPIRFAELCVAFSLAILFARFTGQKGLPDV